MNSIAIHETFVPRGCSANDFSSHAVSVGAGCMWMPVYNTVSVESGRYVQGGGCATVGVAGLVQSGGFGSFSKAFGTAAAGLLEAEIVTADGVVRVVSKCSEPDLFWALKGGGGGTFGVVTRLTLRTRPLPDIFGGIFGTLRATSDRSYRQLVARIVAFYRERLLGPNWGEQIRFRQGRVVQIQMVFQGLTVDDAERVWSPMTEWVTSRADVEWQNRLSVLAVPARRFWDPVYLRQHTPALIAADDRPGAPAGNVLWAGDQGEAGQFLHGYRSVWLPLALLDPDNQRPLVDALVAGSRWWEIALHFNKGLAGAPVGELAAARDTPMNPAACDAFALAIAAGSGPTAFDGLTLTRDDVTVARKNGLSIERAMAPLAAIAGSPASYVSESNFFERDWQRAFWGGNYQRLAAVKHRYDPDGLFFVHHGVGSDQWSADGFRRSRR